MSRIDLTREQGTKLYQQVQPMTAYIYRLNERLKQLDTAAADPLTKVTQTALAAMQDLLCEAHSRSCRGQMG